MRFKFWRTIMGFASVHREIRKEKQKTLNSAEGEKKKIQHVTRIIVTGTTRDMARAMGVIK